MNKKVVQVATRKLNQLLKKYSGFNAVVLDNWRGNRFIYDVDNLNKLADVFQNEKENQLFSTALIKASSEDKQIFGSQKYLNCKTLRQYQNCYINWLIKKTNSKKEINNELKLIKNLKILYSKNTNNLQTLEKTFKQNIINKTLQKTTGNKKQIIKKLAVKLNLL